MNQLIDFIIDKVIRQPISIRNNSTLWAGPKTFMRTVQGMSRMLTPFGVIQLFSHEISNHGWGIRFGRDDHQSESSKRSKKFHVQSQCKTIGETTSWIIGTIQTFDSRLVQQGGVALFKPDQNRLVRCNPHSDQREVRRAAIRGTVGDLKHHPDHVNSNAWCRLSA